MLTPAQKQGFYDLMKQASDLFAQKEIIWRRLNSKLSRYGEDNQGNNYVDVTLKVLLNYNYMRSWPVTSRTETGDNDKQSTQVLINKEYLRELNFLDSNGLFIYDAYQDKWVIDGLEYRPMGDTAASQAFEDDVMFTIILQREEASTGNKR